MRETPGKAGRYLTGVYFGEVVQRMGEEAYVREEERTYLKVRNSAGEVGWVHEFLFSQGQGLAVIMRPSRIYGRPNTVSTLTDKSFLPGELVILVAGHQGWLHLIGREKKKAGWIQGDGNITTRQQELELASLLYVANSKSSDQERQQQLQQLLAEARQLGSPMADPIQMALQGQQYQPAMVTGYAGSHPRPTPGAPAVNSRVVPSGLAASSPPPARETLSAPRSSRPAVAVPAAASSGLVTESGEVIIIPDMPDQPDIYYARHRDLPAGSRIFLEIPDNPGFVELRVVGRLPSQSRELIGIPEACYDAILRNRRPRVVEVSHWRE